MLVLVPIVFILSTIKTEEGSYVINLGKKQFEKINKKLKVRRK